VGLAQVLKSPDDGIMNKKSLILCLPGVHLNVPPALRQIRAIRAKDDGYIRHLPTCACNANTAPPMRFA